MSTTTCAGCGKEIEHDEWRLKLSSHKPSLGWLETDSFNPLSAPLRFHNFKCFIVWAEKTPLAKMGQKYRHRHQSSKRHPIMQSAAIHHKPAMSEPITISVTMTREQWEKLQDMANDCHDTGPRDDPWQSDEMKEISEIIEGAVASIPPE